MGAAGAPGSLHDVLALLAAALVVEVVVFAAAAVWARVDGRFRVLDVCWPLSFVGVGAASLGLARVRHVGDLAVQLCVLAMVGAWGVRLSAHLAARQRGAPEDGRYTAMLDGAAGHPRRRHPFRAIVVPQAGLAYLVAMPVCAAAAGGRPHGWVLGAGLVVFAVGLCFESVGDLQLTRFRADPGSSGRVLASGLWAWTRHPNYFGDAAVWWGVWLVAASTGLAWLTVLSPLTMTVLLTSVSGRPMLESSLAHSKAGWDEYVARTSAFFPWPPRSG